MNVRDATVTLSRANHQRRGRPRRCEAGTGSSVTCQRGPGPPSLRHSQLAPPAASSVNTSTPLAHHRLSTDIQSSGSCNFSTMKLKLQRTLRIRAQYVSLNRRCQPLSSVRVGACRAHAPQPVCFTQAATGVVPRPTAACKLVVPSVAPGRRSLPPGLSFAARDAAPRGRAGALFAVPTGGARHSGKRPRVVASVSDIAAATAAACGRLWSCKAERPLLGGVRAGAFSSGP